MAAHAEPMDVDCMDSDFENKENSFHHVNVPCTEKGCEELDVSELNMKLRFSVTPASSPMSKSYTACPDNRHLLADDTLNGSSENTNITRSLNSIMNNNGIMTPKSMPLQSLRTEQFTDGNSNPAVLRQLNSTITDEDNIAIMITASHDIDENLSLPSSSSSAIHTPEATTPTKEMKDEGSPIIRGLKSVLNMFRSTQSPVPPMEGDNITSKQEVLMPTDVFYSQNTIPEMVASTPIATHGSRDSNYSKRSSPYKESIVFNDDLEKELNWNDDMTCISGVEKTAIHKKLLHNSKSLLKNTATESDKNNSLIENTFDNTVEYMDVSNNDTVIEDKTMTELTLEAKHEVGAAAESDSEFVDCETTFSKSESYILDINALQEKNYANETTFSNNESFVLDIRSVQENLFSTANKENVSDCKNIPSMIENPQPLNNNIPSDITNVTFTDVDFKYGDDITMPADYSDYSKCTSEILSELDKIEANISSDIAIKTVGEKNVINQLIDVHHALENNKLEEVSLTVEYPENKSLQKTVENEEKEIKNTLGLEQNVDIIAPVPEVLEIVIDTVQHNKTLIELINKGLQSHETPQIAPTCNSEGEYNVNIDPSLQISNVDQKALDSIAVTVSTKAENQEVEIISQDPSDVPTSVHKIVEILPPEIVNVMPNDKKSVDTSNVIQNDHIMVPVETISDYQKETLSSVDLNVTQNYRNPISLSISPVDLSLLKKVDSLNISNTTKLPTTENQISKNPSDIPLPEDADDVENDKVLGRVQTILAESSLASSMSDNKMAVIFPKSEEIETIPEINYSCGLVERKTSNSSILISETLASQKFELEGIENIEIKPGNVKSCMSIPKKDIDQINILPECVSQNINNCQAENTIGFTEIANNAKQVLNNVQYEPMDITMNECLNQTHGLPDLMDQTVVMIEKDAVDNIKQYQTNDPICENIKHFELEDSVKPSEENAKHLEGSNLVLKNIESESDLHVNYVKKFTTNEDNIEYLEVGKTIQKNTDSESILKMEPNKMVYPNECSIRLYRTMDTDSLINIEKQPIISDNIPIDNLRQSLIKSDDKWSESDDQPPKVFTNTTSSGEEVDGITVDEEVIVSANNSPYVSLMSGIDTVPLKIEDTFQEIENSLVTKTNVASSPPIVSKGYNFNFDEIDDPFVTKTKTSLSPTVVTPTKPIESKNEKVKDLEVPNKEVVNRRKFQLAERKKLAPTKNKLGSSFVAKTMSKTFANKINDVEVKQSTEMNSVITESKYVEIIANEIIDPLATQSLVIPGNLIESGDQIELKDNSEKTIETFAHTHDHCLQVSIENKSSIESILTVSSEIKATSSSQSTYYSAGASSTESFQSKNVFNLPEIDDMNFNPFATKSKMRQSPPPNADIDDGFVSGKIEKSSDLLKSKVSNLELNRTTTFDESKLPDSEDKMEKVTSANTSGTTSSSKASDNQDVTAGEINTEDEDTIEGPFLDPSDDIEKITDFADGMMQFNDLHEAAQRNENNLDGEIFIDAEAFEFLLNQNKTNVVADSGKESLFLKFDPLFAKRISSDGVLSAINNAPKKQSTPTKPNRPSLRNEASPIAGYSALNATYAGDNNVSHESIEESNITMTKPTMVVTPAFNPVVTPRNKSITPTRSNRSSITFTSPAMAVIDRLISMSSNNSFLGQDTTITHSNVDPTEADLALTQIRELLAEKEISVYNSRCENKELIDRLATMETQIENLELERQARLNNINKLNQGIAEKLKINKNMAAVVEEYERTIATLMADIEQDKKRNAEEKMRLINERDEKTAHLLSMDVFLSDLHSKYEKNKQVIFTEIANEKSLIKKIKDSEEQITKLQANYEMLKQNASKKLDQANQDFEKINRAHDVEVAKLNAMIKRNQLNASSLQETLAQKTKENDELTAICEELINKLGTVHRQ